MIPYSRFVYPSDWARYGVTDYAGYLASDLWREISNQVLSTANHRCAARDCPVSAAQVHHRSFDHATLAGRYDEYLVAICESHHRLVHWTAHERYRDLHGIFTDFVPPRPVFGHIHNCENGQKAAHSRQLNIRVMRGQVAECSSPILHELVKAKADPFGQRFGALQSGTSPRRKHTRGQLV